MNETVEQKASKPPGLVPKQVQNYVILGVATVLIAIIWLTSGNSKRPTNQGSTSGSASDFTRLNQAKLEEYKAQLAAQERLLKRLALNLDAQASVGLERRIGLLRPSSD